MLVKIIIFIHGSLLFIPSWKSFREAFKAPESLSWYQRYKNALRFYTIFKYQPINTIGLLPILKDSTHQTYPLLGCSLTAHYFELFDRSEQPTTESTSYFFYTYGWDGNLSAQSRKRTSEELYHALIAKVAELKKTLHNNDLLEIIIAGHSHGGNVALNLAHYEKKYQKGLSIDQLLLVGTPVQSETAPLIHDQLFKKIYHFYSAGDLIQRGDIFSTKDHISQRKFEKQKQILPLPKNLVQIEVKIDHKKPAHAELWMFGTKQNFLYRKKLSISPLPLIVFTPKIIQKLQSDLPDATQACVNICKQKNNYCIELSKNKM